MQYTVCIILLFFAALSNGHFLSPAIISSDLGLKPDMVNLFYLKIIAAHLHPFDLCY